MLRVVTFGGLAVTHPERALGRAAVQPRRLALLAVLARAGERGVPREALLAMFWPDEGERARRSLAQAIYALRRDLGDDEAIVGTQELRLDAALVASDVAEYATYLKRGRLEEAAALVVGPFLHGFHLPGVPAFARWADEERTALAREQARVLERLARSAEREGDRTGAVRWWRALAAHDALDAHVAVQLMEALESAGDRAGALQHARIYEALVQQELDMPPDAQVLELAARLRNAPSPTRAPATTPLSPTEPALAVQATVGTRAASPPEASSASGAAPTMADPPHVPPSSAEGTRGAADDELARSWVDATVPAEVIPPTSARQAPAGSRTRWRWSAALAVALATILFGVWRPAASVGTPSTAPAAAAAGDSAAGAGTPTVAVGLIADFREERGGSARPLADMLATNLARARGVRVISPARIHELLHQIGATDTAVGAFVVAARRAGVGELVDGTLYALPDGMLRLDLRRVDVASGAMRAGLTIQGRDLFALADSGTARLLTDMGVAGVRGSIADVTTRSEEAYRVYDLGLRARVAGRPDSARALFARALALDPGFAMAAYHHAMMRTDRADRAAGLVVAARLAERASERERLLIRTRWTSYMAMPELRAIADSLVARYPAEVEGHYYAGMARLDAAEWVAARAPLERAIAMDSLALRTAIGTAEVGTGCTACSALRELARSYWAAGDGAGAVRTARRWTRLQPDGWAAWSELGEQLDMTSRFTDARAAYDSALARGVDPSTGVWLLVRHELRRGRLDEAERLARGRLDVGSLDARSAALWAYFHTLRHQGRLREAEVAARRFRVLLDSIAGGRATAGEAFNHAIILLEAGRSHEAAALFDSIVHGRLRRGEDPHSLARHRPNALALAAWARWRSGDTTSLARLADSTEAAGAVHGWRLQQRMHHEVRAMLLSARGDHARAIDAWRAAMVSPTRYASRQGLEAGRLLTATGRPREAVAVLQPTLRGWIEGLGTLTEGHEALAEAWARIPGQVALDSAAAHWRYVADAWRDGDPGYAARAAAARERLGAIGRRAP